MEIVWMIRFYAWIVLKLGWIDHFTNALHPAKYTVWLKKAAISLFFFGNIDLFRFPVHFTFNRKQKTSTFTGKVLTFGIIIFLIYTIIESDLVKKSNPKTLNQDLIPKQRPSLVFSKENFTVAVQITDDMENLVVADESVFNFFVTIATYNSSSHWQNIQTYKMKFCTRENFAFDLSQFDKLREAVINAFAHTGAIECRLKPRFHGFFGFVLLLVHKSFVLESK